MAIIINSCYFIGTLFGILAAYFKLKDSLQETGEHEKTSQKLAALWITLDGSTLISLSDKLIRAIIYFYKKLSTGLAAELRKFGKKETENLVGRMSAIANRIRIDILYFI